MLHEEAKFYIRHFYRTFYLSSCRMADGIPRQFPVLHVDTGYVTYALKEVVQRMGLIRIGFTGEPKRVDIVVLPVALSFTQPAG